MAELANRSISFLINKWSKQMKPTNEMLDSLQQLLRRAGAIVEEAEGRYITNQAMLQQLSILRKELYKGYYTLDTFRCRVHAGSMAQGYDVGHSFAISRFNPAKRLYISSGGRESVKDLTRILKSLESALQYAAEFIILSGRYPRLARQPYSIHLLLDNCMFGRQMEMELVINFLFQAQDPDDKNHGILPIIGPRKVGKSTLVEHVSIDERVHSYFSQIMFLSGDDFKGEHIVYDNGDLIRRRVLAIVELDGDINEDLWKRFLSASRSLPPGSKFIVTSRSENIINYGTTPPLRLEFFTPEVFWYFFKVRMFGSMDVMEHPKLSLLAMDMAKELNACFMGFNVMNEILKSNVDAHFWSLTLAICRHFKQKNPFVCDPTNPVDAWELNRPILIPTKDRTSLGYISITDMYQTSSNQCVEHWLEASARSDTTTPKITLKDLMFGRAKPKGKFIALAWKSHIPPQYNCVFKCELRMPQKAASRKKRN
ncbi:hypothetical protein HU200_012891 [Digitaria exilis]|uniref:NB-ARC domain-containing protein n=1 Tax=Digitaria exilis TaxID=1010633 RepID=A0A835FEP3_9POAL|nr:hypothetical protein HU200_012891 [Digitaria exilis]